MRVYKKIFLVCAVVAGMAGIYAWQPVAQEKSSVPAPQKNPAVTLVSMDMRPPGQCIEDPSCYFYTFSAAIGLPPDQLAPNGTMEDLKKPLKNPGMILPMTATDMKTGKAIRKDVRVINAGTAAECVLDKECVWFAFYNLVRQSSPSADQLHAPERWEKPIKYTLLNAEGKTFPDVDEKLMQIKHLLPYEIGQNNKANYFILVSGNYEKDMDGAFEQFFHHGYKGNDTFYKTFFIYKNQNDHTATKDCYVLNYMNEETISMSIIYLPIDKSPRMACIDKMIIKSFGFNASLNGFPFSIMDNNALNKNEKTILDEFLLLIIYKIKINSPISYQSLRQDFYKSYIETLSTLIKRN